MYPVIQPLWTWGEWLEKNGMKRYLFIGFWYNLVANMSVLLGRLCLYNVISRNVHSMVEILYVNYILFGRMFCSVVMKCKALFEDICILTRSSISLLYIMGEW